MRSFSSTYTALVLFALLLLFLILLDSPSVDATSPIAASVDKSSYSIGEKITVQGKLSINPSASSKVLWLMVYSSENKLVHADSIIYNSDGSFLYSFIVGGVDLPSGTYQLAFHYDGAQYSNIASFFLHGTREPQKPSALSTQFRVSSKLEGQWYTISGTSVNMTVNSFRINPGKSVIVEVTGSNGTLELIIPKTIINGKVTTVATTDGELLKAEIFQNSAVTLEEMGPQYTDIRLAINHKITGIEISASQVIPEFPLSMVGIIVAILMVSILTIVRLRLVGCYVQDSS